MRSRVSIAALDGSIHLRYETEAIHLEAPNWTRDGRLLILNGNGVLWRLPVEGGELEQIRIDGVPKLNNDHVLDPDGEHIYLSANDWHIYRAPLVGGTAKRITVDTGVMHFLHGVSPDGAELAFVGLEPKDGNWWARANVFTVPSAGGEERRLTHGTDPADGCEYSPDGEWIYFNTEAFSTGHAQIARMRRDGSGLEQLTFDERVNWFPHLAPDGAHAVYLSFPSGTRGHPAGLHVELCLVANDWTKPLWRIPVFGGQGTINVNSWAPSSDRFAFVSYAD